MNKTPKRPVFDPPPPKPSCVIETDKLGIGGMLVSGITLDIGTRKNKDAIGWGATLMACELRLFDGTNAIIYNATFENCRFVAVRDQEDLNWRNIRFLRCIFEGVFRLSGLGIQSSTDASYPPKMEECDFSKARLDYCSFGRIDLSTTLWPESPHVIFFHPGSHREEIHSIVPEWPLQGLLQDTALHDDECFAVAYSLPFLEENRQSKKNKYGYPPDQFDRFLEVCRTLDFVRINF